MSLIYEGGTRQDVHRVLAILENGPVQEKPMALVNLVFSCEQYDVLRDTFLKHASDQDYWVATTAIGNLGEMARTFPSETKEDRQQIEARIREIAVSRSDLALLVDEIIEEIEAALDSVPTAPSDARLR